MASVNGTEGNDTLSGTDGDDIIRGFGGDDLFIGGFGADRLLGGNGNDLFRFNSVMTSYPAPTNTGLIDGGAGYDIIDLTAIQPTSFGTVRDQFGSSVRGITVGSQGYAIDGVEEVRLGGGGHYLSSDNLQGITLRTGFGNDSGQFSGSGSLYLEGGDDNIFLSGKFGGPLVQGLIDGGSGKDTLRFNILFTVDVAAGTATSGQATFAISGFERFEGYAGGANYSTTIRGSDAAEVMVVQSIFDDAQGSVTYDGRGGDDVLSGSLGGDRLDGGSGNDILNGRGGDDILIGGSGYNQVNGGDGFDTLLVGGSRQGTTYLNTLDGLLLLNTSGAHLVQNVERLTFDSGSIAGDQATGALRAFDPLSYIASYGDLRAAFGANASAGRAHLLSAGMFEGRADTFDSYAYLASYADLRAAFGTDTSKATAHYITNGAAEGRTITFDAMSYLAANEDLRAAFGTDTYAASKHYVLSGLAEHRAVAFDGLAYIASYADLSAAYGANARAGIEHYVSRGATEERSITFNALDYAAGNKDVAIAYGTDVAALTTHYIQSGRTEGRALDSGFDETAYLLSNEDLGAAHLGPIGALQHWIESGIKEGRGGDFLFGHEQTTHTLEGTSSQAGRYDYAGDHDWYAVRATASQQISLSLSSDVSSSNVEIHLGDGSLLDRFDTGQGGSDASFTWMVDSSDTYFVAVSSVDASQIGAYALDVVII